MLRDHALLVVQQVLQPTTETARVLSVDGYDPLRESSIESRFAIRNGFPGIRGARAASRGARWVVVPARTCVAGLFDVSGTDHQTPGLVQAAHWLRVRFLVAGEPCCCIPATCRRTG
jgi:trehalose/maltose hydrolase-like predicted phosphorylase